MIETKILESGVCPDNYKEVTSGQVDASIVAKVEKSFYECGKICNYWNEFCAGFTYQKNGSVMSGTSAKVCSLFLKASKDPNKKYVTYTDRIFCLRGNELYSFTTFRRIHIPIYIYILVPYYELHAHHIFQNRC